MTDHAPDPALLAKAETLTEALPYLQRYAGATFVVKYGGHAMGDPELARDFAEDVVLLKAVGINPIVVHGGGPQIGAMLKRLGVESQFVGGLRVTDAETARIAEMVLAGSINKEIVGWIGQAGGRAVGISGKDAALVTAEKVQGREPDPLQGIERHVDLGFVGEPVAVDPSILIVARRAGLHSRWSRRSRSAPTARPTISTPTPWRARSPAACGANALLPAHRRRRRARQGGRAADRSRSRGDRRAQGGRHDLGRDDPQGRDLRGRGRGGVDAAVILDGRVPHAMLLEIFTRRGAGTLVHA